MTSRWKPVSITNNASIEWISITYSPQLGMYLAISDGTDPDYLVTDIYATSADGLVWVQRQLPISKSWADVIWTGTAFCATSYDGAAATSYNGITWTTSTLGLEGAHHLTLGNNRLLLYYTGGESGFLSTAYSDNNGVTWTTSSQFIATGFDFKGGCAWNGSVFCVLCLVGTNDNKCVTSPDGVTWTIRNMPVNAQWNTIAWNGVTFLALAQGNATLAATSPDGINWTQRTAPLIPGNNGWRNVFWDGVDFYALPFQAQDTFARTKNGVFWHTTTVPYTIDTTWYAATGGVGRKTIVMSLAPATLQGVYLTSFWESPLRCEDTQ